MSTSHASTATASSRKSTGSRYFSGRKTPQSSRQLVTPQTTVHSNTSRQHRSSVSKSQVSREQRTQIQSSHRQGGVQSRSQMRRSNFGDNSSDAGSASIYSSSSSKQKTYMDHRGVYRTDSPTRRSVKSDATAVRRTSNAKKVIEDLNKSLSRENRLSAITHACSEFDHWDEAKHNAELQHGAAEVLSLILSNTDDDDEIRMLCAALEMVLRSSHDHVKAAFEKVGSNLLPVLLILVERCESGSLKHSEVTLLNTTKVIYYISRVSDLRPTLASQHGMLDMLQRVSASKLNVDCRVTRMRVFANLANSDDNKGLMMDHPNLLESVLRVAALDTSEIAREYASVTLMDLSSAAPNQAKLAQKDKVLGTLVKLAVLEQVPETRESAVSALQNLAFAKDNRVRLVNYGNGVVLEALKKTVGTDSNEKARRRAAGALTNLACDETAERMGCHKGLLQTLAVVSTKDSNVDVQGRAAMVLTKVAASITVDMPCHYTLLDALVVASMSKQATSISAVLRVKARAPENREEMAHHPGIHDTILDMCAASSPVKDRDNAMRALMHMANDPANVKLLCSKTVLSVLVEGASMDFSKEHEIPQSAMTALERLATDFSNRPHMAKHEGLLTAVAKATEREAKLEATSETPTHPLLAKALLMSLLVAM